MSEDELEGRYKAVMRCTHPDQFYASNDEEVIDMSCSNSACVTVAHDTLAHPDTRAYHLLKLKGWWTDPEDKEKGEEEQETVPTPPALLMMSMELREAIERAKPGTPGLVKLEDTLRQDVEDTGKRFNRALSEGDRTGAVQEAMRLRYLVRALDEVVEKKFSW
ncbi:co-chaperone Hsc20 [Kipferlia bialata]|uniref:Co-chaperone Hsc20 n=1 Tax=Kipferlia bialata TaxID=797122 RepID=A0A9K3D422_9EUKA|nr:co-chaperone Hsc20 [Kipferlia bialata]|eukprot:g9549.t1